MLLVPSYLKLNDTVALHIAVCRWLFEIIGNVARRIFVPCSLFSIPS